MQKIRLIKVALDKMAYIDRRDWVKYLTLSEFQTKIIEKSHPEILETVPSEHFIEFIQKEIGQYLSGEKIDKGIQSAIMNCADMHASGEQITLRAGDYIALQMHHRNMVGRK
jgi:hypothetical protein